MRHHTVHETKFTEGWCKRLRAERRVEACSSPHALPILEMINHQINASAWHSRNHFSYRIKSCRGYVRLFCHPKDLFVVGTCSSGDIACYSN
jgi:hypothetical protein